MIDFEELKDILNKFLFSAIEKNEVDKVKYLLKLPDVESSKKFNDIIGIAFSRAAKLGRLELVKLLLTSPEFKSNANAIDEAALGLYNACHNSHFEVVNYLLNEPALKSHYTTIDGAVGRRIKDMIYHCCLTNKDQLLDCILTSNNLNRALCVQYALFSACDCGRLDTLKSLVNSPNLREHLDIHENDDLSFRAAYNKEHYHIIEYLIFEYNIEKTEQIEAYINTFELHDLDSLFQKRELNQKLNADLGYNSETNKKSKL